MSVVSDDFTTQPLPSARRCLWDVDTRPCGAARNSFLCGHFIFFACPPVLGVSPANLPKEIDSTDPNFLKKKNDTRINNSPYVEYARRSVSLMNRLRSDRSDAAGFSIKERKTRLGQNVQGCFKAGEILQEKK